MAFEIIDFHTHPFTCAENNICAHKDVCDMDIQKTKEEFLSFGVSKICGSVVSTQKPEDGNYLSKIKKNNDDALRLKEIYGSFYVPGFHVHPKFVDESVKEIHRMHEKGIRLIGELVPYLDGWDSYACDEFSCILEEAQKFNMVVSFHSSADEDGMDALVKRHPNVTFVAAHPGEYNHVMRHLERMKMSENYYLDLSGTGLFRYGVLRKLIDKSSAERILYGSDYPICNTSMFLGGVLWDNRIKDSEKEMILSGNAKRILGIK
ncbi:MAG: amidohydrolase [Clostridia bacterium]|nr:amidohydrolase [Clostridia bacterium]